jgi:hypothetical protein
MNVKIDLNYDLNYLSTSVHQLYGNRLEMRIELQAAARIYKAELKLIAKHPDFKKALLPLVKDELDKNWAKIKQVANILPQPIPYPLRVVPNYFWLSSNGGKKIHINFIICDVLPKDPWTEQELENLQWR